MPPRRRTDQFKHTPASPGTSTSHVAASHHHHLRHTGPSTGTRARVSSAAPKLPLVPASEGSPTQKVSNKREVTAEASRPGARTAFTKFMYVLLSVALVLLCWYVYGMVTLLEKLNDEIGWWGIIADGSGGLTQWEGWKGWGRTDRLGRKTDTRGDLEGSLNALADALGVSPVQVASAVKPLVPQASLASKAGLTRDSDVMKVLFQDTTRGERDRERATLIVDASSDQPGREGDAVEGVA